MAENSLIHDILTRTDDRKYEDIISALSEINRQDHVQLNTVPLFILRNYTIESIEHYTKFFGYKYDLKVDVTFSNYDGYLYEILDKSSSLNTTQYNLIFLTLFLDNIPFAIDDAGYLNSHIVANHMTEVIDKLKESTSSIIAVSTFLPPLRSIGLAKNTRSIDYCLKELNQRIRNFVLRDDRLILIDYERIMLETGFDPAFDLRYWFMFKSPLSNLFQNLVARELSSTLANIKGIFKKVIILDCDNTLWGGIVGEDGLNGIKLSKNDYPGNIYYCFQEQLLSLQKSGVLLALCSKNNERDVLTVIDNHSECLLKRENLAAWKINWDNKVANIISLSNELNLNLDSFIFVDDDSLECERVSRSLPMVEVIQVPKKIYELPTIFRKYNFFNKLYNTKEEENLTERYIQQKKRISELSKYEKIEDYIASLELEVEVGSAHEEELARVSQLTQKTNQFNLTAKRYGVGEIEEIFKNSNYLIIVLKVKDKFGEYGLTGLSILKIHEKKVEIIEFLLSCRILGRMLEDVLLNEIIKICIDMLGSTSILAKYIKTQKNEQVMKFYDDRGFQCVYSDESRKEYSLGIEAFNDCMIKSITINRR